MAEVLLKKLIVTRLMELGKMKNEATVDSSINPTMTDRDAAELAYGLLWMVGCDRSTKVGEALYLARKALYEKMDRDGQARGITAARAALGTAHIRAYER